LHWSLQDFTESTKNNNQLALELFFQGGFSPNSVAESTNFVASLPFIYHTSSRFAVLDIFRKNGLNFDTESDGTTVGFLTALRFSPGRGRHQTIADEILYVSLSMTDDAARREIIALQSYGLSCQRYIQSYAEWMSINRNELKTQIGLVDKETKILSRPSRGGNQDQLDIFIKDRHTSELAKMKSSVAGQEAYLARTTSLCSSK